MRSTPEWHYIPLSSQADGMLGGVCPDGAIPALASHFHAEIQITVMLGGVRRLLFPSGPVTLSAGQILIVPPGLRHASLEAQDASARCWNAYLPTTLPQHGWFAPLQRPIPAWMNEPHDVDTNRMRDWAEGLLRPIASPRPSDAARLEMLLLQQDMPLDALARQEGFSREGFTRRVRRLLGIAPQDFRLTARLNTARAALGSGTPAALAALDAGFFDQSHLGRHFRARFGTTPDAFRRSVTSVPDASLRTE